jgi:hypothetical protein
VRAWLGHTCFVLLRFYCRCSLRLCRFSVAASRLPCSPFILTVVLLCVCLPGGLVSTALTGLFSIGAGIVGGCSGRCCCS